MADLIFSNPEILIFLLAIPLLIVTHLYLFKFTKKKAWLFSNVETLKRVRKDHKVSKNLLSLTVRILTITCIVFAAAGPTLIYQSEAQTTDYVLLIDTSASMSAQDLEPTRFEAAKQAATDFVQGVDGVASFGVVTFAGYPIIEQTLSTDRQGVIQTLENTQMRGISGSDPSAAIITSTNLLVNSGRARAIILFSDGANTAYLSEENSLEQAAQYARRNEVTIHAVGVGAQGDSPVGYLPSIYNVTASYDAASLELVTQATQGNLYQATDQQALQEELQELLENRYSRQTSTSLVIGFLLAALILLFAEWGLANTRYRLIP